MKQLLKKLFPILIVLAFLVPIGCFNPLTGRQETVVTITIGEGGGSRALCFSENEGYINPGDLYYSIWLINDSTGEEKHLEVSISGNTASARAVITPGVWTIGVTAYHEVEPYIWVYAMGTTTKDIQKSETVHITMKRAALVEFESNGGSHIDERLVPDGEKIYRPDDPINPGYALEGWYIDPGCTDKWDFDNDTVEYPRPTTPGPYTGPHTITLFANWDEAETITINGSPEQKNYGIGEPFNGEGLTITAIYKSGDTRTLNGNDPNLEWDTDFSNTAGVDKTVTLMYGPLIATVSGINVLSLNERVNDAPTGAETTIYLYADENISDGITINDKSIILEGYYTTRTIRCVAPGSMFMINNNGSLTLDNNVILDGSGLSTNDSPIIITGTTGSPVLNMKYGSMITEVNYNVGTNVTTGGVYLRSGTFNMEGGIITENRAVNTVGGVRIDAGATFNMSGGSITSNGDMNGEYDDVIINATASSAGSLNLSGDATIGILTLYTLNSSVRSKVTIAGEFSGSVGGINLVSDTASNAKNYWTKGGSGGVPIITAAPGVALTRDIIAKFSLNKFVGNYAASPELIEGYHLYGSKSGENNVADFGKLVTGAEESGDAFKVSTPDELSYVGRGDANPDGYKDWTLSANYIQKANIDMTGQSWTPIGSSSTPFAGSFDGGGFSINNLTTSNPSAVSQGLFSYIHGDGVVKNVILLNCTITGDNTTGGIAGYNYGTVQNCSVSGSVTGGFGASGDATGGVVGENRNLLSGCYAVGSVNGGGFATGGVAGSNNINSEIKNCYSTCVVKSTGDNAGGVAGYNGGSVSNCYATGSVSGASSVGGVAGTSNTSYVINCLALNDSVTATDNTTDIGRVVGNISGFTLGNNYGRSDMTLANPNGPLTANPGLNTKDGANVTPENATQQSWWGSVSNWDISSPWDWNTVWAPADSDSGILPTLRNMPEGTQNPKLVDVTGGGGGEAFQVSTLSDLQKVGTGADGWTLSASYKQVADIDMTGVINWSPIGYLDIETFDGEPFSGVYDGGDCKISNLTFNSGSSICGLFGIIDTGGVVKNIELVNSSITGNTFVGTIAGVNLGTVQDCKVTGNSTNIYGVEEIGGAIGTNNGEIKNVTVAGHNIIASQNSSGGIAGSNSGTLINCAVTGLSQVNSGDGWAGGVAGANNGRIEACSSTARISTTSGDSIGGVAGQNGGGDIISCYATGNVDGNTFIGGIVGNNINGIIQKCFATGTVQGAGFVGGIAGENSYFSDDDSLPNQPGVIENCYSTGSIISSAGFAGGIAGRNSASTIQNCYAAGGIVGSETYIGGVVGHNRADDAGNMGRVLNCVALNNTINAGTGSNVGRVGYSDTGCILSNNHGRNGMMIIASGYLATNTENSKDGMDVIATEWGSTAWWGMPGPLSPDWADPNIWDFSGVSATNLPTLLNMPGKPVQNPQIQ